MGLDGKVVETIAVIVMATHSKTGVALPPISQVWLRREFYRPGIGQGGEFVSPKFVRGLKSGTIRSICVHLSIDIVHGIEGNREALKHMECMPSPPLSIDWN